MRNITNKRVRDQLILLFFLQIH